jgi:hypothetical protein
MPGTDWQSYVGQQLNIANTTGDLQALGQALHALQDAHAHDLAGAGMWDHRFGLSNTDNPLFHLSAASEAIGATNDAIRDFMKGRGKKPKCKALSE